jgi:hypothetical protein
MTGILGVVIGLWLFVEDRGCPSTMQIEFNLIMDCCDSVMFGFLLSVLSLQTISLLISLSCGQYTSGLFEVSSSLLVLSWGLNALALVSFAKQATHYCWKQFTLRLFVFFPVSLVLTNSLIGLHPRVLSRCLKFVGITETEVILKAVTKIYCCRIATAGLLDVFAQVLVTAHNHAQVHWVSAMLAASSSLVCLAFFVFSVGCYYDVINRFVLQFELLLLVSEKLLKPNVFESRTDGDFCAICRDAVEIGQLLAEMAICSHTFHEK